MSFIAYLYHLSYKLLLSSLHVSMWNVKEIEVPQGRRGFLLDYCCSTLGAYGLSSKTFSLTTCSVQYGLLDVSSTIILTNVLELDHSCTFI